MKEDLSKYEAPEGQVWVCLACGKRAKNRVSGGIDRGWDAACFLNSRSFEEDSLILENGRVVKIKGLSGEDR